MPTPTDLVTDLPADFEVFGQAVDTSLADLKGGTSGQILSKNSNTDMDFVWITNDQGDLTAITAGTGIAVTSGTGPVPSIALDLTAANTFTAAQTATALIVTGSTVPTNGMYLSTTNTIGFSTNSVNRLTLGQTVLTATFGTYNLGNAATGTVGIELGANRTVDGSTYIDLIGDTTYTDAGLRIIRGSGANGVTQLTHRGTGTFSFIAQEAASIAFNTTNTTRMTIGSTGEIGIGTTPVTARTLTIQKSMTGATTSFGINNAGTIQSDVTSVTRMYISSPATQAAAFTITEVSNFYANGTTIGAGSTVTNNYGFIVDAGMTTATNNYGFFGNIPSGTNRWNVYMAGTASNYFQGRTGVGVILTSSTQFGVTNQQSATDVTVLTRNYASQTANSISVQNSAGSQVWGVSAAGLMQYISGNTATTVGAAGAASALPANPTGYLKIDIGGTEYKVPYYAA